MKNEALAIYAFSAVISMLVGLLLIFNIVSFSDVEAVLIGAASILGGVMMVGYPTKSWKVAFGLMFFGIYAMLRGIGVIEFGWIQYVGGAGLVALSLYYIKSTIQEFDKD